METRLFYIQAGYHSYYYIVEAGDQDEAWMLANTEYGVGDLRTDFTDYSCEEIIPTGKPGILL